MSKIKIGTASWSEGKIPYPNWCRSPKDKLGFYSARFPMVEVDSTHYAIHTPETIASWVEYTPKDFVFNVKVFGLFTLHWTQPKFLPVFIREKLSTSLVNRSGLYYRDMPRKLKDRLWETFDAMLEPLLNSRKLDVVILQFSSGFIPGPSSLRHLEECRARLSKYKVDVEFRNRAWFEGGQHKRTFEFLERNNLLYVEVDPEIWTGG